LIAGKSEHDGLGAAALLAHTVRDSLGHAYNRTEFVDQCRAMLQAWADFLDKLRRGPDVVPLRKVRSVGAR
jgi:hypothetical protein